MLRKGIHICELPWKALLPPRICLERVRVAVCTRPLSLAAWVRCVVLDRGSSIGLHVFCRRVCPGKRNRKEKPGAKRKKASIVQGRHDSVKRGDNKGLMAGLRRSERDYLIGGYFMVGWGGVLVI